MFVVDTRKEKIAVDEARKLKIPVIGIVDTNCDPDEVDYVIPGNDDALRSIRLFASRIADAVVAGRSMRESARAEAADEQAARRPAPRPRATCRPRRRPRRPGRPARVGLTVAPGTRRARASGIPRRPGRPAPARFAYSGERATWQSRQNR